MKGDAVTQATSIQKPVVDWLTVIAIAAIAISLTVALHEGVHALACVGVGGDLEAYSALAVSCDAQTVLQEKVVAGSAPFYNLIMGIGLWLVVRRSRKLSSETWYFLWLFMLMNLLYGSGYFMFSGIAGVGDIAGVISGWEPGWMWRVLTTIVGSFMFMFFVWLALKEFGTMVGGDPSEQIKRANKLSIISYVTSLVVVLIAGLFNPLGFLSLPVTAGLLAALGGLSPLLWMMQWFQAKMFTRVDKQPLEIHRKWQWIGVAIVVVFIYTFVLGRTLYF
jgi:hypothetical protein